MDPWHRTNAATKTWSSAGSCASGGSVNGPFDGDAGLNEADAVDFDAGLPDELGQFLPVMSHEIVDTYS